MMMRRICIFIVLGLLVTSGSAQAAPGLFVGAAEDSAKWTGNPDLHLDRAKNVGFGVIRMTSWWRPDLGATPDPKDVELMARAARSAQKRGMWILLDLYPQSGRYTPRTVTQRTQFAAWAAATARELAPLGIVDYIVGCEPNSALFWAPQFGSRGEDVAAIAYTQTLALTYDSLKRVSAEITVYGGGLSGHGQDRPGLAPLSHSPGVFLRNMARAYKAMGRKRPLMDVLSFHPYPVTSAEPPGTTHPGTFIGLADYPKLLRALSVFNGTAQRGSDLPIVYDEWGVDTDIHPEKIGLYQGVEREDKFPVAEPVQADYFTQAIRLAYCQPTVIGILNFHVEDEADLGAWQSGTHYADGSPKESAKLFADAISHLRSNPPPCGATTASGG